MGATGIHSYKGPISTSSSSSSGSVSFVSTVSKTRKVRRRVTVLGSGSRKSYMVNNSTGSSLQLQYNPETIPYSRGAKYTSIESPGMSYPLTQYTGGNAREFSFEVFMYDRPYTGKIDSARRFFEALLPPESNSSNFKKPPTFTFAYGYFVKTYVLTELSVNDELMDSMGRPVITRFNLSVRQVGK